MFTTIEHQFRIGIEFSTFVRMWRVSTPRTLPTQEEYPSYFDTIWGAVVEQNRRFKAMGTSYRETHNRNQYSLTTHNADNAFGSLWTIHSPIIEYEYEHFKKKEEEGAHEERTEKEMFSAFLAFRLKDPRSNRYDYPKGCVLANCGRLCGIKKDERRGKVSILGKRKDGRMIKPERMSRRKGRKPTLSARKTYL